jgi:hypothetical protein
MRQALLSAAAAVLVTVGAPPADNPVEVGSVRWSRDLDAALAESARTGRPVFLLFQEVPGCAGCQTFGKTVLTDPLLVEAIEDEFHPVLIHNNKEGADKRILDRFEEPAWNYQVVRFLDADARDLIPRRDRVWTIGALAPRMIRSLRAAGRPVPRYLEAVAVENDASSHATTAFAMHCFWTGEQALGGIDGVITTEAGWLEGREVTRVVYDRTKISLAALTKKASDARCATKMYAPTGQPPVVQGVPTGRLDGRYRRADASDQKKQIERWRAVRELPGITAMQRTKINALAPTDRAKALEWLSPRQRRALDAAARRSEGGGDRPTP